MLTALITIDIPGIFEKKVIEHQAEDESRMQVDAYDFCWNEATKFIEENDLDEDEAAIIYDAMFYTIKYIHNEKLYAVCDTADSPFPMKLCKTRADAEEFILEIAGSEAYRIMMTEDPKEVVGEDEWVWNIDFQWLRSSCGDDFVIVEIDGDIYG